jgi:hypothetical protein
MRLEEVLDIPGKPPARGAKCDTTIGLVNEEAETMDAALSRLHKLSSATRSPATAH